MTNHDVKAAEEGRLSGLALSGDGGNRTRMDGSGKDPFLVTWNGSNDPENPKNWNSQEKWAATFVSNPIRVTRASNIFGNAGCGIIHVHLACIFFHCRSCYPKDL
jgi:hypothetical protein